MEPEVNYLKIEKELLKLNLNSKVLNDLIHYIINKYSLTKPNSTITLKQFVNLEAVLYFEFIDLASKSYFKNKVEVDFFKPLGKQDD